MRLEAGPVVRCIPSSPRWMESFYIGNLVRCLQAQGIEFDLPADASGDFLSARWLRANANRVNLLHFHWTHYHYTAESRFRTILELPKFLGKIVLARRLGYRIVWTMHNYMPHERPYPLFHYLERFMMARLAHAVIVHCEHGRYLLEKRLLRRDKVFAIPLANFGPYLPPKLARHAARRQLGIAEEATVYYFFGLVRPYKQVPQLLREFATVPGTNLTLIITGATPDDELKAEILHFAVRDSRVLTRLEYLSDAELAIYLGSADVAVFPFRDILGSGSAMLALSSGLPVIAPRAGCLAELITPACGMLYDPGSGALAEALRQSISRDLRAMGQAAQARAKEFPWEVMVQEIAQVYRKALEVA